MTVQIAAQWLTNRYPEITAGWGHFTVNTDLSQVKTEFKDITHILFPCLGLRG